MCAPYARSIDLVGGTRLSPPRHSRATPRRWSPMHGGGPSAMRAITCCRPLGNWPSGWPRLVTRKRCKYCRGLEDGHCFGVRSLRLDVRTCRGPSGHADEWAQCLDDRMKSRSAIGPTMGACLLALTSCSTDARSEPAGPPSHGPQAPGTSVVSGRNGSVEHLSCDDSIGTAHPPVPGLQVILGVVALPTSTAGPALGTSRTGQTSSIPRLFAKTGLLVRAGADFRIVVPQGSGRRLGIGWGSSASPSKAVAVSHCPRAGLPGNWIAFAGGYWLNHPACVALQVQTVQETKTVHIGLGTPCPGQRPPPQPSQS